MRSSGDRPDLWFREKVESIQKEARSALAGAAQEGEQITKHHIETRGTAKSGKRGRVDTGTMRDSVDSAVTVDRKDLVRSEFGWLGQTPFYAKFQELGTDQGIEGMYALTDAFQEVTQNLEDELKRGINGV